MFYAIEVTYKNSYTRVLPYRLKVSERNLQLALGVIKALNLLMKDYKHEIKEVSNGPETFKQ
jgi:hypothetical protein